MGVKIVHCADIHIGFSGGEKRCAARRRAEVFRTFLRAIDFAKEQSADLFLIAGDLFDSHRIGEDVLGELSEAFSAFSGKVFISPGNHDYYGDNTFWSGWKLPENVTVFKSEAEVYDLPELGVRIFGSAFDGPYKKTHALSGFSADDSRINIAVIHGDLAQESVYGPISETDIGGSRMDYIALGHIHKRSEILKNGETSYAYCGCIEGQGFDEIGEKGIYFGTVEKGRAELEFVPVCTRRFVEEKIDISSARQKSDVPSIILRKIIEKYGEKGADWLYKIVLTGETAVGFTAAEIAAALENELYFAKVRNKTRAPMNDLKDIAKENSVKGIFVRKMLERMDGSSDYETETALRLGLMAFSEEVGFDED